VGLIDTGGEWRQNDAENDDGPRCNKLVVYVHLHPILKKLVQRSVSIPPHKSQ
jgi:hypothetical protein